MLSAVVRCGGGGLGFVGQGRSPRRGIAPYVRRLRVEAGRS
jgi:hypothetical protein